MMWLTLDIGNSRTKGGLFSDEGCLETFDVATPLEVVGWQATLRSELGGAAITRAGLTSVVPDRTSGAVEAIDKLYGHSALVVTPWLHLPFSLGYATPETLGTDRLAAAAAAWARYGPDRPVVALDAGTALTYEVVTARGIYLGGIIAPGPHILRDALADGTAQLPSVELSGSPVLVGRSTREALRSGILHGFLDSVKGMLERLEGELANAPNVPPPVVVATGGWGAWLAERLDRIHHVDPHLVLYGICELLRLNAAESAPDAHRTGG